MNVSEMKLKFAEFELNGDGLRRNGAPVPMNAQAAKLLRLLLERRGELVTRDEIRAHVWPDVHVGFEDSINTAIRQVRAALGDSAASPRFIETVRGEGYRFRAPARLSLSLPGLMYAAAIVAIVMSLTAIWFVTRPQVVTITNTIEATVPAR